MVDEQPQFTADYFIAVIFDSGLTDLNATAVNSVLKHVKPCTPVAG